MDIPLITLVLGETYYVIDFYGEIGFRAIYRGIAEADGFGHDGDDEILVFERAKKDKDCHRFAGVIPEVGFDIDYRSKTKDTIIGITLRASYYGDSVEKLRHVTQREIPQFTFNTR